MAAAVRPATPDAIGEAVRLLAVGRLVAFPTETVYGLGCDAANDGAVAAVFAAKGRPRFNPLIVHVADLHGAARLALVPPMAESLAARFWPGPLTLVMRRRPDAALSLLATAGLDTVAVRAPDHPAAQALLAAFGAPIAAPSANRSEAASPTTAAHVLDGLADVVPLVLDGGPCRVGLESTVLDLTRERPALLRPGGLAVEAIEALVGPIALPNEADADDAAPRSPGLLRRHYAPRRPLRMNAAAAAPGEALLGFGGTSGAICELSSAGDLVEAAANFFAMLRALDAVEGFTAIAAAPIPDHGLGRAINDRLRRASADPAPSRQLPGADRRTTSTA